MTHKACLDERLEFAVAHIHGFKTFQGLCKAIDRVDVVGLLSFPRAHYVAKRLCRLAAQLGEKF